MQEQFDALKNLLQVKLLNNTIQDYILSTAIMVGLVIGFSVAKQILVSRIRFLSIKTKSDLLHLVADLLAKIGAPVFIVSSLYIATLSLDLKESLQFIIRYAFVFVVTIRGIRLLHDASSFGIEKTYKRARPNDPGADTAVKNLRHVVGWALWILGSVFVLDNLGVNISAVVAGLGIGGIAVAMASQSVLGDAFSAIAIFVDKPFQVGDAIMVGDLSGTVEHVGIKTTRIRSIHGEQLIFSNSDLTGSRIRNLKRMTERRISFEFGITYQTTTDQLKRIPGIVRDLFKSLNQVKLDRVHFKKFGDSALVYEVAYFVLSPDYNVYMDKQEALNIALKEAFEREGINFAYPTQTLYVAREALDALRHS